MKKLIDPPALTRSADIRSELAPKIRATFRRTEEDRRQLGAWLIQCKEACLHAGEPWLEWLERETGIPHDTATRYMNGVENKGQATSSNTQPRNNGQDESEIKSAETTTASTQRSAPAGANNAPVQPPPVLPTSCSASEREPGCDDGDFDDKDRKKDEARAAKYKQRSPRKDSLGNSVPDGLRDVFGDPILAECIDEMQTFADGFRRVEERLKHKIQHFPYALADKLFEALADGEHAAQLVRDSLKPGVPYVVCPSCAGKNHKCKVCRAGCGYLSQWRYEELREQGVITE